MPELVVNERGDTKYVPLSVDINTPIEEQFIPDIPEDDLPSWREGVEEFARRQEYRDTQENSVTEANIYTPTNKIHMLVMSGDKHIGAEGFAWRNFVEEQNIILNNPNISHADMGDIIHNLFFNKNVDVATTQEQVNIVSKWAKEMLKKAKWLFTIGGNHDVEWFWKRLGLEFYAVAFGYGGKVPYLREGGMVNWKLGQEVYKFYVKHRSKYNSDLNPHHTNHRMYWMVAQKADVIASAHTHSLTTEHWAIREEGKNRDIYFSKTGSQVEKDRHAAGRGFIPKWQTGSVCYCLHPFRHEIWQVVGVKKGLRLQKMLQWEMDNEEEIPVKQMVEELSNV